MLDECGVVYLSCSFYVEIEKIYWKLCSLINSVWSSKHHLAIKDKVGTIQKGSVVEIVWSCVLCSTECLCFEVLLIAFKNMLPPFLVFGDSM